jgi:hypothetical protein
METPRRALRRLAGFAARVLLVLILLEGAISVARVAWLLASRAAPPLAERSHTTYDAELGWVNRPGVSLPDLYGPGASLHVNAQGFRGRRDVAARLAPGRIRAICSGDSFALGYGVDDDATWCHQLEQLVPGLETVNMGQGGYGVDQAWLWFRRDGARLEHQLHLFTFIAEDFARMTATEFFGYAKPRLRLDSGTLRVDNVPVPRSRPWAPWLVRNGRLLDELRTVRALREMASRAGVGALAGSDAGREVPALTAAVLGELAQAQRGAGRSLVLVWLPMREEHRGDETAEWRGFLRSQGERLGVPCFDLVEELRSVPPAELAELFLEPGEIDFPAAAGHYSVRGNRLVAEWIRDRLAAEGLLPRR